MKIRKGFVLRKVCGENVIIGEGLDAINFGKMLSLNETAAWLWEQASDMKEISAPKLAEMLCNEYDVTPAQALADVTEVLSQWNEAGVLE